MNRRNFLIGGAAALTATSLYKFAWLEELQKEYSNVLMLIVDDLNDWIGPLQGHPNTKTPNIDRLASQATVFTNAHAPAPLCGPSRASIMTGLAPSTTGIYGHVHDDDIKKANDKAAESVFMSEYFKQHGYYTAAVGKVFHQGVATGSFDDFGGRVPLFGPYPEQNMKWDQPKTSTDWGPYPERDDQMPDYDTARWLEAALNKDYDQPFFIAGGFLRPHVPWHVPQKWFDMHPAESLAVPAYLEDDLADVPDIAKKISDHPMMPTTEWAKQNDEWQNIVQGYLASVSFVDSCIGIVLDALEQSAHKDNTAVVLWGDHGYSLGEKSKFAKMSLWERATRTPLIIKPPRGAKGQYADQPVSLLDLYPTLIKICGLPANKALQGNDISPILSNPGAPWQTAAVTTYGPNNHSIRTDRYRYISYEDGSEELYDHATDEHEWHNLADKPEYQKVIEALRMHLPTDNAEWSKVSQYKGNEYFLNLTEQATNPDR